MTFNNHHNHNHNHHLSSPNDEPEPQAMRMLQDDDNDNNDDHGGPDIRRGLLESLRRLSCHIPTCVLREMIAKIQYEQDHPDVVPIAELTLLPGGQDQGHDHDDHDDDASDVSSEYEEDLQDEDDEDTKNHKPRARRDSELTAASVLETLDNVVGLLDDCGLSDHSDSDSDDDDKHHSGLESCDDDLMSSRGSFGEDSFGPPAGTRTNHHMDPTTAAIAQVEQELLAQEEEEEEEATSSTHKDHSRMRGRDVIRRSNTFDANTAKQNAANAGMSQSSHLHYHDGANTQDSHVRSKTPPPGGSWKNRVQGLSTRVLPASSSHHMRRGSAHTSSGSHHSRRSSAHTSSSSVAGSGSGGEQCMTKLRQGRLNQRAATNHRRTSMSLHSTSIHSGSGDASVSMQDSVVGNTTTNSVHSNSRHSVGDMPGMPAVTTTTTWNKLDTTRRASALLFVDISGFTKLSTVLDVESFSKIINTYFEKITHNIQSMGGDILKFAGDAIMAEWMPQGMDHHDDDEKEEQCDQHHQNNAVLAASLCAAKLVEECSDFVVDLPSASTSSDATSVHDGSTAGSSQATLNIYCAVGFGVLVGTHVGDADRMEYVVLGDPIQQVAVGMQLAQQGEVVASQEAFQRLNHVADFVLPETIHLQKDDHAPLVIARKSQPFFQPRENEQGLPIFQCTPTPYNGTIISRDCGTWSMEMLSNLQGRLNPYVHPVVKADEAGESQRLTFNPTADTQMPPKPGQIIRRKSSAGSTEKRQQSPSEVRDVCTVFLQPTTIATEDLTGSNAGKEEIIEQLGQIMLIVNSEVTRVQAHLRQFIVDDKGLVIIASFGLRGSTFPNMIEGRAMPCVTNIIKLLRSELDVDCKIGVTYGKAFCGVVGGHIRHEYAILGRSVNLAARLMAHPENPSILVDEAVKEKAGDRPFEILCPVKAKGYGKPVKIFRPEATTSKSWVEVEADHFVGRSKEVAELKAIASKILYQTNNGSSVVLLSASYGMGKSFVLSHSTQQIEKMCTDRRKQYHIFRHVCSEDDSFRPFSLVMPLFQRLLGRRQVGKDISLQVEHVGNQAMNYDVNELKSSQLYVSLLQTCMEARIPLQYIEIFAGLIFTDKLSDIGKWSDKAAMMSKWDQIAHLLVKAYVHCTQEDALVVLALDDVSGLDELSWKIIQGLTTMASNILVITTARYELNVSPEVWDDLEIDIMRLEPMNQNEIFELTQKRLKGGSQTESMGAIAHTVFLGSDGNPLMANKILQALYNDKGDDNGTAREAVEELLLNRLDSLSPAARSYLSLGALLGMTFELANITTVMVRYHHIKDEEQAKFATTVGDDLQDAAKRGYLQTGISAHSADITYTFSHPLWQEALARQMLAEWRVTMTRLIGEVLPGWAFAVPKDISVKSEPPIKTITDSMDSSQTSDTHSEMTSSTGADEAARRPSIISTVPPKSAPSQTVSRKAAPPTIEPPKERPSACTIPSAPSQSAATASVLAPTPDAAMSKLPQTQNDAKPTTNLAGATVEATNKPMGNLPSHLQETVQNQNKAFADDLKKILGDTDAAHGGEEAIQSLQELISMLDG